MRMRDSLPRDNNEKQVCFLTLLVTHDYKDDIFVCSSCANKCMVFLTDVDMTWRYAMF